jgi:hypothetical protein
VTAAGGVAAQPVEAAPGLLVGALQATLADPRLWLLGSAGFLLRGGLIALLLPVAALPTPIEIRLLIGNGIGSAGPTSGLYIAILIAALLSAVVMLLALYGLAWLEVWSYQRLAPTALSVSNRELAGRVFTVEAGGLIALALAVVPLIIGAVNVTYDELIVPSSSAPLYARVLAGVPGELLLLAAAVVIVEFCTAILIRRVLVRASLATRPRRSWRGRLLVAAAGWLASLAALLPSVWALSLAWHAVRQDLAGFGSANSLATVPTVLALALVWVVALGLTGFASALRGALWSRQERP